MHSFEHIQKLYLYSVSLLHGKHIVLPHDPLKQVIALECNSKQKIQQCDIY